MFFATVCAFEDLLLLLLLFLLLLLLLLLFLGVFFWVRTRALEAYRPRALNPASP